MKSFVFSLLTLLAIFLLPDIALAAAATPDPVADLLSLVVKAVTDFGGLTEMAKVSTVCLILCASMKVDLINKAIWDYFGDAKVFVAPLLALIGGFYAQGTSITLASALTYIASGFGAVLMHQILDGLKKMPGIGPIYVSIINIIEGAIAPAEPPPPAA